MLDSTTKIKIAIFLSLLIIGIVFLRKNGDKITIWGIKNQELEGKIIKKEIVKNCGHRANCRCIIFENKFELCRLKDSVYNIIDSGDYVIKKKGSSTYILIKSKDTTFFEISL